MFISENIIWFLAGVVCTILGLIAIGTHSNNKRKEKEDEQNTKNK